MPRAPCAKLSTPLVLAITTRPRATSAYRHPWASPAMAICSTSSVMRRAPLESLLEPVELAVGHRLPVVLLRLPEELAADAGVALRGVGELAADGREVLQRVQGGHEI